MLRRVMIAALVLAMGTCFSSENPERRPMKDGGLGLLAGALMNYQIRHGRLPYSEISASNALYTALCDDSSHGEWLVLDHKREVVVSPDVDYVNRTDVRFSRTARPVVVLAQPLVGTQGNKVYFITSDGVLWIAYLGRGQGQSTSFVGLNLEQVASGGTKIEKGHDLSTWLGFDGELDRAP